MKSKSEAIALPAKLSPVAGWLACAVCGTEFRRSGRQVYCRTACHSRAWRVRHPSSWRQLVREATRLCSRCKSSYVTHNVKRIFCSARCKNAHVRQHWREDPVEARQRARAWFEQHSELVRERARRWSREHPAEKAQQRHARRAREMGAPGTWKASEWRALRQSLGDRCAYCGSTQLLTIDHVIPLVRGGSNAIDNLVVACRSCNSRKGSLTAVEFAVRRRSKTMTTGDGLHAT